MQFRFKITNLVYNMREIDNFDAFPTHSESSCATNMPMPHLLDNATGNIT